MIYLVTTYIKERSYNIMNKLNINYAALQLLREAIKLLPQANFTR